MPCPLFLPATTGCEAQPGIVLPPGTIRRHCHPAYARHTCPHAAASPNDAMRFLVKSDRNGLIEVAWSLERTHHPVAVGTLTIEPAHQTGTPLEQQAFALASEYLRRKGNS